MCNLNLLFSNIKNKALINGFLQTTTTQSFKNNNDGDGIFFNSGNLYKIKERKLNLSLYKNDFKNSNIFLSHQRFTTSGKEEEYTQPFKEEEFILLHNGVINQFLKTSGSDTFGFLKDFLEEFKKDKNPNREQKILKTIKKLLDWLDYGSFSIILYDLKTKISYYFKNDKTSIYGFRSLDKKTLYLTTLNDNSNYLYMLEKEFKPFEIVDFKIYKIEEKNNEFKINVVGKIEKVKIVDYPTFKHNCRDIYEDEEPIKYNVDNALFYGFEKFNNLNNKKCIECKVFKAQYVTDWKTHKEYFCLDCVNDIINDFDDYNASYSYRETEKKGYML